MTIKYCNICQKDAEFYDRQICCNSCYKKKWRLNNLEKQRLRDRVYKQKLRKNKFFREKENSSTKKHI